MLTIRTAAHIRGAKSVKGFRSCPASTGVLVTELETNRLLRGEAGRCTHESRRRWLARQWEAHRAQLRIRYSWPMPSSRSEPSDRAPEALAS